MTRAEHDMIGERLVPGDAYWGVHTLRAVENFAISGTPIGTYGDLVVALASIKQAAAETNRELGVLDAASARAISAACEEIRAGELHEQFVVDVIQGGAGTSTNMNANEVIANRALELLGRSRGDYAVLHPIEHVNRSQSTNDVYPTAIKLALTVAAGSLREELLALAAAFAMKAGELDDVMKVGRTQLQDAVPMTMGQELGAYAVTLREDVQRLEEARLLLHEINLGGTAIGTGITAPRGYAERVCAHLSRIAGLPLTTAPDLVEATQDSGVFVHLSGVLKRIAVKLSKTCNDLRLLSSGPHAGLGEIRLPAVQAGSSLMPGKVNPVIPEVVNQVAFKVIGHDVTVTMASEAGQLQLNAFEPIIFRALVEAITHLAAACATLRTRCVVGISVDREVLARRFDGSLAIVTALNPHIGYEAATCLALEALQNGRGIAELALERGLLTAEQLADALSPDALTSAEQVSGKGLRSGHR